MHSYNFKSLNSSKYKLDLNILFYLTIISFTAATLFENNYVQGSDDEPATKIITILILIVVYYFLK
jgi:Ca2+/H+ antiporter